MARNRVKLSHPCWESTSLEEIPSVVTHSSVARHKQGHIRNEIDMYKSDLHIFRSMCSPVMLELFTILEECPFVESLPFRDLLVRPTSILCDNSLRGL